MKIVLKVALALATAAGLASTAHAGELLGGVYAHDLGPADREGGADIMLDYRTAKISFLNLIFSPEAHVMVSANTSVSTDFVAAGFSWPISLPRNFYIQPGIGLAYTTGKYNIPAVNAPGLTPAEVASRYHVYHTRIDFGDPVLFEPELAFGYHFTPKWSAEVSYVHLSNGQIFHQGKNEGLDDVGLRVAYRFGVH
jgi:hypothetical protein